MNQKTAHFDRKFRFRFFTSACLLLSFLFFTNFLTSSKIQSNIPTDVIIIQNQTLRNPIVINSDSDFTPVNGVIGGKGTINSPYLLAGYEISVSAQDAVLIRNTSAHFILKDFRISMNEKRTEEINGITLENVKNGTLQSIFITGVSGTGIKVLNSSSITIKESKIFQIGRGIHVRKGSRLRIQNNEIAYIRERGINLEPPIIDIVVSANHVHHTTASGVGGEGIEAWGEPAENITIEGNEVHDIAEDGVEFVRVQNSKIINNSIHDNQGQGIDLFVNSNNNLIVNNFIFNNHNTGILITNSYRNIIFDNVVYNNTPYGIWLEKRDYTEPPTDIPDNMGNLVYGTSPWSNLKNNDIRDDTKKNTIVYPGYWSSDLIFPVTSEGQLYRSSAIAISRVKFHFTNWQLRVEMELSNGTTLWSAKRIPPNIYMIDIVPTEGSLGYILKHFDRNVLPDQLLLDMYLRRESGKGLVTIDFAFLASLEGQYETRLDGALLGNFKSKEGRLHLVFKLDKGTKHLLIKRIRG